MAVLTPDCCVSCGDAVNAPNLNSTRASLEVARVALGRMMGAPTALSTTRVVPVTMAARAAEAWNSSEIVLRALTGRPDLAGQELLAEARRTDGLDMEGMHALVTLREWVERTLAPGSAAQMLTLPPTDAERDVAAKALGALERAAGEVPSNPPTITSPSSFAPPEALGSSTSPIPSPPDTSSRSPWAAQPVGDVVEPTNVVAPKPPSSWPPQPAPPRFGAPPATANTNAASSPVASSMPNSNGKRSISSAIIMALVLLVVVSGSVGAFLYFGKKGSTTATDSSSPTAQGVAAYARGSKEAARLAFVKAIAADPNDARALTYLGRISRELGSTATARQYLERAIRVDPNNALASRELASALLADQQYELARRFYVRALTLDPNDRVAQGFLGCSLLKLNRNDEAQRWIDRAGAGEWRACAQAAAAPPSK